MDHLCLFRLDYIELPSEVQKTDTGDCEPGNLLVIKVKASPRRLGGQWLSSRVLDPGAAGSSLTGITVLWSFSKTHLS